MINSNHKQSGFTVIELLITLFIAAAFLMSGFQLYAVIIKDGGATRAQSNANDVVYNYLQQYKKTATNPCTAQTPLTNQSITVNSLTSVTVTVAITCPYGTTSPVSKVDVSLKYNTPQVTVTNSVLTSSACPTGYIVVPGSKTYGTDDFCVMKYEAKNDGDNNAISVAAGVPWTSLPQTDGTNTNVSETFAGRSATDPLIIDGVTTSDPHYAAGSGVRSVTVDLGIVRSINTIKVWHYSDGRIYNNAKTEVSADNVNWTTVFDSDVSGVYTETAAGRTTTFAPINARYIRDSIHGSNKNIYNHWVEIQAFATADATAKSAAACAGCHLITDAEWLTIAQNVTSVSSNWSGGAVGSGYIYSGHNDSTPANTLAADPNDSNGYSGETNTGGNQRRTLTLSNGEVIWDFAGNIWEWTSGQTAGGQPGLTGEGSYAYKEWNAITALGSLSMNATPAFGIPAASAWNSTSQGIGAISSKASDLTLHSILRGGGWMTGANAGIFALATDQVASYSGPNAGFRVAVSLNKNTSTVSSQKVQALVVAGGGGGSIDRAGAGGGGGVIYNSAFPVIPQAYAVTIGNGGTIGSAGVRGGNGGNSVFSSLVAIGGGGGGTGTGLSGSNGGSGGGGGNNTGVTICAGGLGTTGQGYNGGLGVYWSPNYGAGGGGGAGGPGSDGTATSSGNGGNGLAYSISGASVYYGGGGGAGSYNGGTNGIGGLGGGGNGSTTSPTGGTANTGGGGGSSGSTSGGASGGSGIVIISYPTGSMTATGGTITTSGGNTIHTFTSNGTFTVL